MKNRVSYLALIAGLLIVLVYDAEPDSSSLPDCRAPQSFDTRSKK